MFDRRRHQWTKDGQGFFAQFDPSKVDIFYPLGPGI